MSASSSGKGAGVAGAAGVGLLALCGGIGKMFMQGGDDLVRIVATSGDDVMRGAGGAFQHGDDLARSGGWGRGAGSLDDFGGAGARSLDDLPRGLMRPSSPMMGPGLGDDSLVVAESVAVQESRVANSLGRLSSAEPAQGVGIGSLTGHNSKQVAGATIAQRNAESLADLMLRAERGRSQLAAQAEALRKLQSGTQAVDAKVVLASVGRQHDRSLQVLSQLHAAVEQAPTGRLVQVAADAEAVRATASPAAALPGRPGSVITSELANESRSLAVRHGAHFLKELLQHANHVYQASESDERTGPPLSIPALLQAAESDPSYTLGDTDRIALRVELAAVLEESSAELESLLRDAPRAQADVCDFITLVWPQSGLAANLV